jgi:threonine/homoserine/homoserine lactone efflux protein
MIESILTMAIAGFLTGFIFSVPIAGPISIMITSNALKGRLRYCNLFNVGASFADFIYVFIAVFGLTRLYTYYKPLIPYIFLFGAFLLIFLAWKLYNTKIDIEHLEDRVHISEKIKQKEKGAFYTGFMINLLNPTLFIGWLTSSLLVISFISALGFHTGGLAVKIDKNAKEIGSIEGHALEKRQDFGLKKLDTIPILKNRIHKVPETAFSPSFHIVISLCYALFVAAGSVLWFYLLAFFIVRFRRKVNIKILLAFIKGLGVFLALTGVYFGFKAVMMFIKMKG